MSRAFLQKLRHDRRRMSARGWTRVGDGISRKQHPEMGKNGRRDAKNYRPIYIDDKHRIHFKLHEKEWQKRMGKQWSR